MLQDKRQFKTCLKNKQLLMADFIRAYLQDMRYESAASTGSIFIFPEIANAKESSVIKAVIQPKQMPVESQISVIEQLQFLIDEVGINISQLSDLLKVGRPSIYKWLDGAETRRTNSSRIDALHFIFKPWNNMFGVKLGQYLYKKIDGQFSLYDLLSNDKIDIERTKDLAIKLNRILLEVGDRAEQRRKKLEAAGFAPVSKQQKNKLLDSLIRKA